MAEIAQALYRKYRPQSFAEVRNQDHIVRVLEGALKKSMIPHALLFTGPRGTGKTTVARIFAHAIGASDVDIYEMDAASNRGIDDIRELNESVHTVPYESPYKVYIIDEVHMLTKEAFNALLKTLEEPPSHVVFILATTERDKLLDTITSRCQVFEFRKPTREELRDVVTAVALREKCTLTDAVADTIALAADGSYRDALGITQKVMLAGGDDTELSADEVAVILGVPKQALIMELLLAFHSRNLERGISALESASTSTLDVKLFVKLLLERMRSVLLLRFGGAGVHERQHLQYSDDEFNVLLTYAKDSTSGINSQLLGRLLEMYSYLGKTTAGMLPIELVLIEHCT